MSRPACSWIAGALAVLALAGCRMVGPDPFVPPADVQPGYRHLGESGVQEQTMDLCSWWTVFDDPLLNDLVDQAARQNITLRQAFFQIAEARALRGLARSDLGPQVAGTADYNYNKLSLSGGQIGAIGGGGGGFTNFDATFDNIALGSNLFWEIDVFGRLRRNLQAANADVAASIWDYRDILVILQADVATNYITARTAQQRLEINRRNLETQTRTLELTQKKFKAGQINELDVAQAKANVYSTASQIPTLEIDLQLAVNRLSILLGRPPGYIDEVLAQPGPIPSTQQEIAIGIPADLLRRRSDIRGAEQRVMAQTARIGVAIGDFYPKYRINGNFGLNSQTGSTLFTNNALGASIGPGVEWNLFSFGRVRMNVRAQEARESQFILRYQEAVLRAAEEVDNALVSYERQQRRRESLSQAVEAYQRSVELSEKRYDAGADVFQRVLDAQRLLLVSEEALAQSEALISTNLVQLFRALAGGWQAPQTMNATAIVPVDAAPIPSDAEPIPPDNGMLPNPDVPALDDLNPAQGEAAQRNPG